MELVKINEAITLISKSIKTLKEIDNYNLYTLEETILDLEQALDKLTNSNVPHGT